MIKISFISGLVLLALLQTTLCGLTETINMEKMKRIFQENIASSDPANFFYSVKGYSLLGLPYPNTICDNVKAIKVDESNIEQAYYISGAAMLTKCQQHLSPAILKVASAALDKKEPTILELFYAVKTMKALGKPTAFDKQDGFKTILQLLKKDDSPTNYGYLMQICLEIDCGNWIQTQASDILAQTDEIDGKMLQWEGGLPVTANILTAILRSFASAGKPTPLNQEHSMKFSEYLLFRTSVNQPKGAALLLETATLLSADKNVSPVVIAFKGKNYISSSADSILVTLTDLIGQPAKEQSLTLQSATRESDGVVVASKKQLSKKGDAFELQLGSVPAGKYKAVLSAGRSSAILNIVVLTTVKIANAGLAIADLDGATQPQYLQLSYPTTHSKTLNADHLHKISLKFKIIDDSDKAFIVQQAFVRVGAVDSNEEVVFVAETDSTNTYKVEIMVSVLSQHFNHQSGAYVLDLYIGDNAISTPLQWRVVNLDLKFVEKPKEKGLTSLMVIVYFTHKSPESGRQGCELKHVLFFIVDIAKPSYELLPEITHKFREAEPRPPRLVSDVFALAAASPLLLLLILWGSLRINIADFPFSLSAIIFHLGLGSILSLLVVFWLKLTMFETLRYLLVLGLITFVSGHRLLKHLVKTNKF